MLDLEEFDEDETLADPQVVVLMMSCYGEGEPTSNAEEFYEWLMDDARTRCAVDGCVALRGCPSVKENPIPVSLHHSSDQIRVCPSLGAPRSDDVAHLKYMVFGLGQSKTYPDRYQAVGIAVDKRMAELGAERLLPRGEGPSVGC